MMKNDVSPEGQAEREELGVEGGGGVEENGCFREDRPRRRILKKNGKFSQFVLILLTPDSSLSIFCVYDFRSIVLISCKISFSSIFLCFNTQKKLLKCRKMALLIDSFGKHLYISYIFLQNEMALDDLQPSSPIPSNSNKPRLEYMDLTEATTVNNETQHVVQSADYAPLHPSTRSWEVEKQHVTVEKIIGKGAFGQVAKGTATGLRGRPGKTTVAVKMLKC